MDALSKECRTSHYLTAAAITALAYDIVISLDEEITHIWSAAWTLAKFLYIFLRYYPLVHICITFSISTRTALSRAASILLSAYLFLAELYQNFSCKGYWAYYGLGGLILIVPAVSLIFFLRVSAIYGFERKMIVFLTILFLGECACELATTIRIVFADIPGALSASDVYPGLPGCTVIVVNGTGISFFQILAWIPLLCGSSTTFFLTLMKLRKTISTESTSHRNRLSSFLSPLTATFFSDGILFFFLIFFSSLILMVADSMITVGPPLSVYLHSWFIVVYSCSGSRLILNLRRFSTDNQGDILTVSTPIVFNPLRSTSSSELATPNV